MEINPFLSVWTQPKETVRQFIKNGKLGYSMVLVSIAGIGGVITGLQDSGWFQDQSLAFWIVGILIAGIISGFLNLGINSLLYTLIGKLYGGHGKLRDMAIAIGPTMVPQIFILPLLIIYVLIYGERFFAAPADFSFTSIPLGAYLLLSLLIAIASIWSIVITSKAIAVVHEFSSLRGFGVFMTIVGIFVIIALLVVIGIFIFLF
ncbi:YIP1 family protein [Planococcus sp. X10-3]|uniref:YIP1 family protein n=1 Tax=Planococcus sp. X10-3 TaxID=3061240 RepID=UPI003BAF7CD7